MRLVILAYMLIALSAICGGLYVAIHFISKYW